MNKEIEQKYINKLKDIQKGGDIENRHIEEDRLLCDLLEELGYIEIVKLYDETTKWFA